MKINFYILASIFGVLTAASSHADTVQGTKRSMQAIDCSVVFSAFLQVYSGDFYLNQRLRKAIDIFTDIALKEMNLPVSDTEIEAMAIQRSNAAHSLLKNRSTQSPNLREDSVMCGAWAEGLLSQGEHYQYVPVYPKVVAPSIRAKYQIFFDRAFIP